MELNKSTWKMVRFGDCVIEKKITIDARSCGLERYIAGEHMVSEDLHLRRWGIIGEDYLGPAFHRLFEKGDILYGSRRTYLKKVAVADFDGITANTTFVLREDKEVVVPGLIPFLMLSDAFTNHSIKNSKGSVNPYINYKDIAKYEFLLPPKDQQAKLAELLWAADENEKKQNILSNLLYKVLRVNMKNRFNKLLSSDKKKLMRLGQIGKWLSGGTPSTKNQRFWNANSILWVTPKDAKEEIISSTEDNITEAALEDSSLRLYEPNSFCVVWRSGILQHSLPIIKVEEPFTTNQDIKTFIPNKDVVSEFIRVYLILNSEDILQRCVKSGTTVQSIDSMQFYNYLIPMPEKEIQQSVFEEYNSLYQANKKTKTQVEQIRLIKQALVNQIFN